VHRQHSTVQPPRCRHCRVSGLPDSQIALLALLGSLCRIPKIPKIPRFPVADHPKKLHSHISLGNKRTHNHPLSLLYAVGPLSSSSGRRGNLLKTKGYETPLVPPSKGGFKETPYPLENKRLGILESGESESNPGNLAPANPRGGGRGVSPNPYGTGLPSLDRIRRGSPHCSKWDIPSTDPDPAAG